MKKIITLISFINALSFCVYAQQTKDTTATNTTIPSKDTATTASSKDTAAKISNKTDLLKKSYAAVPDSAFDDAGVSVSPSSMHLSIKPGKTEIKEIKVKNSTKKIHKFQVGFSDFEMSPHGKPMSIRNRDSSQYGLSKWINVAPSYFELKPGQEIKIKLNISIPDEPEGYKAHWTIVTIDMVPERPPLDVKGNDKTVALGIIPSFGFGVYVYQNPPNVLVNKLAIKQFVVIEKDGHKQIKFEVKNVGDGISYCKSYVELTNLNTGKQQRLKVKNFTILPQFNREFYYDLDELKLSPGKYHAMGVIDFGSDEEILATEMEIDIK
ncbi:MAG: hypothetical protein KatS3mg028_0841 [Bacteroidia bacterium]|nr:MAG: hypothetical protein KatS3mg028_0841 [Bacteroidia bacterium]